MTKVQTNSRKQFKVIYIFSQTVEQVVYGYDENQAKADSVRIMPPHFNFESIEEIVEGEIPPPQDYNEDAYDDEQEQMMRDWLSEHENMATNPTDFK